MAADLEGRSFAGQDGWAEALARALALRGRKLPRWQAVEALGDGAGIEGAADAACALGQGARVVQADPRRPELLEAPTLVQLRGGGAAVLLASGPRGALLEWRDGERSALSRDELGRLCTGFALEFTPPYPEGLRGRLRPLAWLLGRNPQALGVLAFASAALGLLAVAGSLLLREVVDAALPAGATSTLSVLVAGLAAASLLQAWATWLQGQSLRFLQGRVDAALSRWTLTQALRMPFPVQQSKGTAQMAQSVASAQFVTRFVIDNGLPTLLDSAFALMHLLLLAALVPGLGLSVALGAAALVPLLCWSGFRQGALQEAETEKRAEQAAYFLELIAGAPTLKAAGVQDAAVRPWVERFGEERRFAFARQRLEGSTEALLQGAHYAAFGLSLVWGGHAALAGSLSAGTLVAALQSIQLFLTAYVRLAGTLTRAWHLAPHLRRAHEPFELCRPPVVAPPWQRKRLGADAIVLSDLWFRHGPGRPWVLRGFDLRIAGPGHYRLTGRSGTGKTTLLRLLAGLYEPERGTVTVNGCDPSLAAQSVAYVPQELYLFQGSILDNLRLLSGHAPRERLVKAADAVGLAEALEKASLSYETVLGPGGGALSGGQRQLIALAAAAASERPIVLLDEATSHLDRVSRARVWAGGLFEGRCVVSVEHEAPAHDDNAREIVLP